MQQKGKIVAIILHLDSVQGLQKSRYQRTNLITIASLTSGIDAHIQVVEPNLTFRANVMLMDDMAK
jgi:hypothetical protein